MHLKGWIGPLSPECADAVRSGQVQIYTEVIKGVEYELLVGSYTNASGVVVQFQR